MFWSTNYTTQGNQDLITKTCENYRGYNGSKITDSQRGAYSIAPTIFSAFYRPTNFTMEDCEKFLVNNDTSVLNNDKDQKIFRQNDYVEVLIDDNVYKYTLPIQENELHSTIFGIDNIVILNNLLAVYYIDQEKGWTLLNRGKIIGNIRFNIEEFVAGISEIDINNLLSEKKVLNNELKKYEYIQKRFVKNSPIFWKISLISTESQ